ncbi:MAG: hypothetical protein J7K23_01020 [Thermoproteales archaeon]|nr:hypothetical protein [Thermoproteales archaeon]
MSRKSTTVITLRVDDDLLEEFERLARKEFGSRNRALIFLIQVYVESRKRSSIIRRILNI